MPRVELSPRIQDQHIQKSVQRTVKPARKISGWRIAWLVVLVLAIGAVVYAGWKYVQYGRVKAVQLVQTGDTARTEGRLTDALVAYDGALALGGISAGSAAEAAANAASIYDAKGRESDAQRYLRRAYELQQEDPRYAALLARSLIETRQVLEADELLAEAQSRTGDTDAGLSAAQARAALARLDPQTAVDYARQAANRDPENAEAAVLNALLRIHEAPAESAKTFEQVLKLTQDKSTVRLVQALRPIAQQIDEGLGNDAFEHVLVAATLLEHADFGMLDAARNECIAAIEADETYRDAWSYRGAAEVALGELDAAGESLSRAKELDPTFGYTRYQLGLLAVARGDFSAAAAELRQSIELGYKAADVRLELADALTAGGDIDGARDVLDAALDAFPTETTLHEALFWLEFSDADDAKAAKKVAATFAQDLPSSALATGLVALAAYALDDEKSARTKAAAALKQDAALAVGHLVVGLLDDDDAELTRAVDLDLEGHVSEQAQVALGE